MITYCPACDTGFRVHAEHLAARAGQVRCGKCSRVFNALEHLIEETTPVYAHRPKPEFEEMRADATDSRPARESAIEETTIAETANAESGAAAGVSAFGFGRVAPVTPAHRWPWLLGAIPLLLILLAQAAYHYRGAITLLIPETKPHAAALCAFLSCELPLARRIEQMSIEASDLQTDTTNPGVMVLSATLKNRANFNQQYPFLDLTLTDARDQVVARRSLAPQDYLGKAANTQAGFATDSEIEIKVYIDGSQVKATGYRLDRFYP